MKSLSARTPTHRFRAKAFACSLPLLLLPTASLAAQTGMESLRDCQQAFDAMQFRQAQKACQQAASSGNAEASFLLGTVLGLRGQHRPALHWMEQAASAGHLDAAVAVGGAYLYGKGIAADPAKAARWHHRAAQGGSVNGQHQLALQYQFGIGVAQSLPKALRWHRRAAEQGHAESQLQLGLMLQKGIAGTEQGDSALRWIRSAAESGNDGAQYALGVLLQDSDPQESLHWYLKAAKQDNPHALNNLAHIYFQGIGVKADGEKALAFAERSIQAGLTRNEALKTLILAYQQPAVQAPSRSNSKLVATILESTATEPVVLASLKSRGLTALPAAETSAPPTTSNAPLFDEEEDAASWLLSQPPQRYVLQLAVAHHAEGIESFIRRNGLQDDARYFRTGHRLGNLYMLIYGDYASIREAQAAINELPPAVKAQQPWVRHIGTLQQAYRSGAN